MLGSRLRLHALVVVLAVAALVVAACSDDEGASAVTSGEGMPPTTIAPSGASEAPEAPEAPEPTVREPGVEPATIEGPITTGTYTPPTDPRPVDLEAIGYVEEEYFASGEASSYEVDGELAENGEWDVSPVETPPEWTYTRRALVDAGAAWVGVSAQSLGVVGGEAVIDTGDEQQAAANSGGLVGNNPERYGSLEHPGGPFSFDMFSQIGAALRPGTDGGSPVTGLDATEHLVAAGESQSAFLLTAYVNAFQPLANVYDGFFVHSRGATAALPSGERNLDSGDAHHVRTDLDAPVFMFQTETDVGGERFRFGEARQPDSDTVRTWEVAGTAHADAFLVGGEFALCPDGVNDGPQHYVANAAMAALLDWVVDGTPPPEAEPIATADDDPTEIQRDDLGLAEGGVRTPSVDVPVSVLTGAGPEDAPDLCSLFGGSTPLTDEELASRYGSPEAYLEEFATALDEAVAAGFVRTADADAYLAEAEAVEFG